MAEYRYPRNSAPRFPCSSRRLRHRRERRGAGRAAVGGGGRSRRLRLHHHRHRHRRGGDGGRTARPRACSPRDGTHAHPPDSGRRLRGGLPFPRRLLGGALLRSSHEEADRNARRGDLPGFLRMALRGPLRRAGPRQHYLRALPPQDHPGRERAERRASRHRTLF